MKTTNPELEKAFEIAAREDPYPWTDEQRKEWEWAEKVLVKNLWCPHCACIGERNELGKWIPGNHENYAGRYCVACEEFCVCGDQYDYTTPEYDTDASGQCYSDALEGF